MKDDDTSKGRHAIMMTMFRQLKLFCVEDDAATATEYAVMLALIVIVCMGAISALGTKVSSTYVDLETAMP